jgi:hypothetical protein
LPPVPPKSAARVGTKGRHRDQGVVIFHSGRELLAGEGKNRQVAPVHAGFAAKGSSNRRLTDRTG